MSKSSTIGVIACLLIVALAAGWWFTANPAQKSAGGSPVTGGKGIVPEAKSERSGEPVAPPRVTPAAPAGLTAEQKAARVAKIKRDYDEIRLKASADFSAAGAAFPGGLNAFLRQLALLEREKRADFAKFLTPRELEDLELSETPAGQLVTRLLGSTRATDEQRREAFRLQLAHEDQFALTFDLTPKGLFERELARQRTQEKIRTVLGDELFAAWLVGEGEDYALSLAYASRNGLPASVALELWRVKNDYIARRLELAAEKNVSAEQQRNAQGALQQQVEARLLSILGPRFLPGARNEVLKWLPKK